LPGQTAQDRAYDPSWKPSGNAIWDFFSRPRAKTEGVVEGARDLGLSAYDAATFGYGVPSSLQSTVDQAHANAGIMDPVASALGYAVGPGKILGPLARGAVGLAPGMTSAGASLAARLGGSIGAGALEGAGAGGLGAAGHGGGAGDIAQGVGLGALSGGAAGALGGSGPKPKVPDVGAPQSSTAPATGMYGQKVAAYAPLDQIYFDNHGPGLNQAQAAIRAVRDPQGLGVDLGIPDDVNKIVGNIQASPIVSGRNLQQASQDLRATGDWTGHRFADSIDNTLNSAQPMSVNGVPTGQVGEAGAAKSAGDSLYGRINDLERLGDDPANLTPGAVKKTASFYSDPNSPQAQSLAALQSAMQPKFNWYMARHIAAPILGAGLGGAEGFFNPAEGQNHYVTAATQALEGAAVFGGLHAAAKATPGRALNAARYAVATGQPIAGTPTNRIGDSLVNLLLGRAASNQSPY
jgi:hypothetical protein